jgi:hypothetical protein
VKELATIWKTMIQHLLIYNKHPKRVLVVKYEDLVKNTQSEVLRILSFLGYFTTLDFVTERLKTEFSAFKRSQNSIAIDHFTTSQKILVNQVISDVATRLKPQLLPLKEYLRT